MTNLGSRNNLFKYFWIALAISIFGTILLYQILMHPRVLEKALISLVSNKTQCELKMTIKRSSLLYGFEIGDVELREKDTKKPLFKTNRLNLSWFLPSVFAGHVGIREFRLESPRIYLHNDKGVWNWSKFIKSSDQKPPQDTPAIIDLFFELRTYFKIAIEDLSIEYSQVKLAGKNEESTILKLDNINFYLGFISNPFSSIPLNSKSIYLFDSIILALNPSQPVRVHFQGKQLIKGDLFVKLLLLFENGSGNNDVREFALRLDCNTSQLGMYSADGGLLGYSGLNLGIDSSFDPVHDRLLLHRFELKHLDQSWLSLQARVNKVSVPQRNLLLKIRESKISLEKIDRLIGVLVNTKPAASIIGGTIIFKPFLLEGSLDNLEITGGLSAKRVFIKTGGGHHLDHLKLVIKTGFDIYRFFPEELRPLDYDLKKPLAFDILRHADIPVLNLVYNQARLKASAIYKPDTGLDSKFSINNFLWEKYFPGSIRGIGSLDATIQAPVDFSNIIFQSRWHITRARYYLNRSRSGYQNLNLQASGSYHLKNRAFLNLKQVSLQVFSTQGKKMFHLNGSANLDFSNIQNYFLNISRFDINVPVIYPLLPGVIKDDIRDIYPYLSKGINLKTKTRIKLFKTNLSVDGKTNIELPYLNLNDLELEHKFIEKNNILNIVKMKITALRGALNGSFQGKIDGIDGNNARPDLVSRIELSQDRFLKVHSDIKLQGKILIRSKITSKNISGSILIKDLDLDYSTIECRKSKNINKCKQYFLRKMNLNLPFNHEYILAKKVQLSSNPAREYLQQNINSIKNNLVVESLYSNHNPQGMFVDKDFYYIGSPMQKSGHGLVASLFYKRNVLVMDKLQMKMFKYSSRSGKKGWIASGSLAGKDIFFNLADLDKKNMEAAMRIQVKELDLEPFLPSSQSSYDGIISADIKVAIDSFATPLYNTKAYISVFKISREFSGFVTRVLMPAKIVALLVRNTLEIPRINVELKNGLVYSAIKVNRARLFPGLFIAPGSDEIKQERMPLAKFLDKAKNEVKSIGKETVNAEN